MLYLLAIVAGIILGVWASLKVGKLLWENEKQCSEANVVSASYQAKYELLQEIIVQEKREKMAAFDMTFRALQIASNNAQNTQLYPKPLPSLGLSEANTAENAVYTPNLTPNSENGQIGDVKTASNLVLKKGVRQWLISKEAKLFEGKTNIAIEIEGIKYTCDYSQENGKTNKVSTLPLHLGKCNLPDCNANFLTQEPSSKYCCEQHKNQNNNSK